MVCQESQPSTPHPLSLALSLAASVAASAKKAEESAKKAEESALSTHEGMAGVQRSLTEGFESLGKKVMHSTSPACVSTALRAAPRHLSFVSATAECSGCAAAPRTLTAEDSAL